MKTESFENFKKRFQRACGRGVPVVCELPWLWPPEEWFAAIRRKRYPFLFESGTVHAQTGRWSYIGFDPFLVFEAKGNQVRIEEAGRVRTYIADPIKELKNYLERFHTVKPPVNIPLAGGAFGMFSYDLGRQFERISSHAEDDGKVPDVALGFYDEIVVFDHMDKRAWISVTLFDIHDERKAYTQAMERAARWTERAKKPDWNGFHTSSAPTACMRAQDFKQGVCRALEYISAGDIFQVNLSQRFDTRFEGDPFALYRTLRRINASGFGGYFEWDKFVIASSSPERLVSWNGTWAVTRPIAGTAPRGRDQLETLTQRQALILDPKERAEHLMLVDLERNDLGRISEYGSVRVSELMTLEEYSHVIHIVSEVRGKTRSDVGPLDIVRALFPGGTITGTPKVRAMEIIEELEPVRRGFYTGSMGWVSFSGALDLNIVIRTFVIKGNQATVQVGAGIVADSDPDREYQETLHKGQALFEALEASCESRYEQMSVKL